MVYDVFTFETARKLGLRQLRIVGVARLLRAPLCCFAFALSAALSGMTWPAKAQVGIVDIDSGLRIETVSITISNPSDDPAVNSRIEDSLRRRLAVYPNQVYSRENVSFRGYLATGKPSDFPLLYDSNGTFLTAKLEMLGIYYGNGDAWYGDPDTMLVGNPLVQGKPSGAGYTNWVEGFVHGGIYGITPVTDQFYVYGGLSAIASGSTPTRRVDISEWRMLMQVS